MPVSTIFNADFTGGVAGNAINGYVDLNSITWNNSGQSTNGGVQKYTALGLFTGNTACCQSASNSAAGYLYANSVSPVTSYEVQGIINVQSTGVTNDNAGILGQMQSPAGATTNYVACDYVPNASQARLYYWNGGVLSSVQTASIAVSAGNQIVLRLVFGSNQVSAYYSTTIADYGNSTGAWVQVGVTTALPAGLQPAGYGGILGFVNVAGTAVTGVQKSKAFYSGGGGTTNIAINDANFTANLLTGNWYVNGSSYVKTSDIDAELIFGFSGTSCTLNMTSPSFGGVAYKHFNIKWTVDGGAYQTTTITDAQSTLALASGLSAGNHWVWMIISAGDNYIDDWTPVSYFQVNSVAVDTGSSLVSLATAGGPTLPTDVDVILGDSIDVDAWGQMPIGGTQNESTYTQYMDSSLGWQRAYCEGVNRRCLNIAYGGLGYSTATPGGRPKAVTSALYYFSGIARSFGTVKNFICHLGTNDGSLVTADMTNLWTAIRSALPSTKIIIMIPFGGQNRAAITSAYNAWSDGNKQLLDLGADGQYGLASAGWRSPDSLHPNAKRQWELGAKVAAQLSTGGGGNVTLIGNFIIDIRQVI